MGKINILHIVQHATGGGVIRQLLNLLRSYDADIVNPVVCCIGGQGATGELIERSGFDFVALRIKKNDRFIPRAVLLLYRLMRDRKIALVRTHGYGANLNGRVAALLWGIPCIPSVHNVYTKERKMHRRIANNLLGRISYRVVAVSEAVREDIIRYDGVSPSKVLVIRNGVDTMTFSPRERDHGAAEEMGIGISNIVVGFIGRVVPAKGLQYLIDAFAGIKREIINSKLLIVGRGAAMNSLKELARKRGFSEDIIFAGERNDISRMLSLMDIFVMPSEKEGLPNALLEAMAAAKPVLVTTAGGMKEIVHDNVNGLVVQIGDPVMLEEGMKRLMTDRVLAEGMGRMARQYIEENFSIQATARTWEHLYEELLGKGQRRLDDAQGVKHAE